MAPSSPPVAAWELGIRLREARELVDLSSTDAAKSIGITQNYLSNVEHGRRRIAEEKLENLLTNYGVYEDERKELLALRRASDGSGWWSRYSGLFSPELVRFFGYEHGAHEVHTYEGAMISGLLQTEKYSRAVHSGDAANLRKSEVERRVEARSRRQERLSGPNPLNATILMTEGALRQQVGGPEILAEQLEHLLALMAEYPDTLDLRIIPFSAGAYCALGSSTFHLLTFPSARLVRLGWHETVTSLNLVESELKIHQYSVAFSEALSRAADREGSKQLIRKALQEIT
ncbi:helix-turn-helix transcriptional regulator [Saccharopolyspora sp. K220]|uniref:helix-turn-helix domain-containing protein n=1 Tax=Saccharopolyspora soli TaxID=2926618 RepID=UPI001F55C828|nr:helix-turn-helix transcriptional regulator [Saccharopolyspora soli]MCI2418981.1 helix-turn-helix transcriptional regulator [Saccharopolyspora soli]